MANVENLKHDASELLRLAQLTDRENIKRMLTTEAEKLNRLALEEAAKSHAEGIVPKPQACTVKIINYGWDQSEKFVKLYVTVNNVHSISPENVISSFQPKSLELHVNGLGGKNYLLAIKNLLSTIRPEESYHKVKTDMVVLFLKKDKSMNWQCVTESEKKAKESKAPKFDENEDPGQGLMNLMKQMYEEGDDEMKRTIAKAWTEAREKKNDEL